MEARSFARSSRSSAWHTSSSTRSRRPTTRNPTVSPRQLSNLSRRCSSNVPRHQKTLKTLSQHGEALLALMDSALLRCFLAVDHAAFYLHYPRFATGTLLLLLARRLETLPKSTTTSLLNRFPVSRGGTGCWCSILTHGNGTHRQPCLTRDRPARATSFKPMKEVNIRATAASSGLSMRLVRLRLRERIIRHRHRHPFCAEAPESKLRGSQSSLTSQDLEDARASHERSLLHVINFRYRYRSMLLSWFFRYCLFPRHEIVDIRHFYIMSISLGRGGAVMFSTS